MGKSKKKREERQARKEAEAKAAEEAKAALEARDKFRYKALIAIAVITAAAAAGFWHGMGNAKLAAVTILGGGLLFLMLGLGAIGANVEPRDASKAGAINFGNDGSSDDNKRKKKR